ncbi:ethyl tert-butyl ether degradation protein EthD [Actinomycetospora sp. NBRC 106375]|uniref:EthD family reductase n=1 Tax=Actinomycetospora sp. NBRC 106375 TaxID=3032207 RepID=UPI0024A4200F|nr:EthD family reductase [Actinomycetospora sp. NBRC 106375]GLZ47462.1 ethyl tert-butyl ether degradation protein EthD [Actinomycetospora sp. NBRC 106375]
MHIVTVLYGHPTDPAAFDKHYREVHAPMVDPIPGLKSFSYRHCASLDANPAPYYLIAELAFDSLEDLQAGMGSEAGQTAAGDVPNFASGGATMFVAHD